MTVGHFCPDSSFSSPFDCPAVCLHNVSKLDEPRCARFQQSRWMTDEDICHSRMPCYEWEFDEPNAWKRDACAPSCAAPCLHPHAALR